MTHPSNPSGDPLGLIADEFVELFRHGKRPSIEEFAARYPAHADELRELLPALMMMERAKSEAGVTSAGGETPDQAAPLPDFQQLGDYRILREIGRGGMGIVYEAEQISLGRRVALKLLPASLRSKGQQRTRFDREARAAARLHHTNIVPVFGVGEQDGMAYYVMQFIQGLGLDEVLDELRRLQGEGGFSTTILTGTAIRVSRKSISAATVAQSLITGQFEINQVLDVPLVQNPTIATELDSADDVPQVDVTETGSEKPQIQGGVKPSLSKITSPGSSGSGSGRQSDSVAVSDSSASLPGREGRQRSGDSYWHSVARIGVQVARALDYAHEQGVLHRDIKPANLLLDTHGTTWITDFGLAKATDNEGLTQSGDILGTLRYMPPEAFEGHGDRRGDVYSLGLTLYEMLALQPAFSESERNKLIKLVTSGEAKRLDAIATELPRDLVTIVQKAIERDPSHRYQTAGLLADDLDRFLNDEPILARRASPVERFVRWSRQNRGLASALSGVAALMLVSTIVSTVAGIYFWRQKTLQAQLTKKNIELLAVTTRKEEDARRAANEQALLKNEALAEKQRAVENYRLALENYRLARQAVDQSLSQVAQDPMLASLGMQGLRKQLLSSALGFYEKFLEQKKDDPTLRGDLADALDRVGQITVEIGSPAEALARYEQAHALRDEVATANPEEAEQQLTAQLLEQEVMGRLRLQMNQFEQATETLQKAQAAWQARTPNDLVKLQAVARLSQSLADVALRAGDLDLALHRRNDLYSRLETLVSRYGNGPEGSRLRLRQVQAINGIASLNVRLGQLGQTHSAVGSDLKPTDLFNRSLEELDKLEPQVTEAQFKKEILRERAATLEQLADCQQAGQEIHGADESLRKALPVREQLAITNPLVSEYEAELAATLRSMAKLQARQQNWEAAAELLTKAIDYQRKALAASPEAAIYIESLAQQLIEQGAAYEHNRSPDLALACSQEAGELLDQLANPSWEQLRAAAAAHAKTTSLLAVTNAPSDRQMNREQTIELALKSLERAIEAGLVDRGLVASEPAFEVLKDQPRFQRVIERLEALGQDWRWFEDIDEASRLAAASGRDLMVYFTGSDWCPWCMTVSQGVFARPEFLRAATKDYVLVMIDFPRFKPPPRRMAENDRLAAEWDIDAFPSFVFCDSQRRRFASYGRRSSDGERPNTVTGWLHALAEFHERRVERDEALVRAQGTESDQRSRMIEEAFKSTPPDYESDFGPEIKLQLLSARIERTPTNVVAYRSRAEWHAGRGDWSLAAADLHKIVDLSPTDSVTPMLAGAAYFLAGDAEGWEQLAGTLLARAADTNDPQIAERAAKMLLCTSLTKEASPEVVSLAERSVTLDPKHWVIPYAQVQKALSEYRTGHDRAAIAWAEKLLAQPKPAWFSEVQASLVKAMAHQRLGEESDAHTAFDRGARLLKQHVKGIDGNLDGEWHDRQICMILRSEAEERLAANQVFMSVKTLRDTLAAADEWHVMDIVSATSATGATLTPQPDGSILVSGDIPNSDVYTIATSTSPSGATAIRLEAIPDNSLPQRGPGRHRGGFFMLTGIQAQAIPAPASNGHDTPVSLRWTEAAADAQISPARSIRNSLDPAIPLGWAAPPGEQHEAIIGFETPSVGEGSRLTVRLEFQGRGSDASLVLGRFRLLLGHAQHAVAAAKTRWALDRGEIGLLTATGVTQSIQGDFKAAATSFATELDRQTDARSKARVVEFAELFPDTLSALAETQPEEPMWQLALERHYTANDMHELEAAARARALELLEVRVTKSPENEELAAMLADTVLKTVPGAWAIVEPTEMTSEGGATLSVLEDKSVLVTGRNPNTDQYRVKFRGAVSEIAGVRLEAIPDASARGAVGRSDNGNFVLSKFTLQSGTPIRISKAVADHSQPPFPAMGALDDDPETGWAVLPLVHERRQAVFTLAQPMSLAGQTAEVILDFKHSAAPQKTMGRFRLAVATPEVMLLEKIRTAIEKRQLTGAAAAGAAYALAGDSEKAAQFFGRALDRATGDARVQLLDLCQDFSETMAVLTKRHQADARFSATLARVLKNRGDLESAAAARAKALSIFDARLDDTLRDRMAAAEFASLLLAGQATGWTTLVPSELRSVEGALLAIQPDGSILATGSNPEHDTYVIKVPAPIKGIRVFRLEVLPDPRLPHGSSGRARENGNFALSEFRVFVTPQDGGLQREVTWSGARSNHEVSAAEHHGKMHMHIANAIDRDSKTYWENYPRGQSFLEAVFLTAEPVAESTRDVLTIGLESEALSGHNVGRFRLAVSDDADQVSDRIREAARDAILGGRLAPAVAIAWAYLLTDDSQHAAAILKRAEAERANWSGLDLCFLAIAQHRAGQAEAVQASVEQAKVWLRQNPPDVLVTELVRQMFTEVSGMDQTAIESTLADLARDAEAAGQVEKRGD